MADAALAMEATRTVPPHVPADLVIESDFHSGPGFATDPFGAVAWQTTGPRIFYSPTHYLLPGCWVVTRAEDIRYVLQTPELFSSSGGIGFSALIDEAWDLIPVELDPPHHAPFRALLNPLFSPKEVGKLETGVRLAATSLVDRFADADEVEFIGAFAQPFPVSVFLQLLGLPLEEMPQFLEWEAGLLKSFSLEDRKRAAANIVGYLRNAIKDRRANPGTDLISWATHSQVDGRALTDDEVIGICFLMFIAGLDTVASSLGFHYHYLATHPELQAQLRADRSLIPTAVEEFMRLYSIVINHRRVVQDTEIAGVTLKKGDWMTVPTFNASLDPAEFQDPRTFILDRPANRHVAFSYGPHRCLGSHLARREFVVAMNEIFDRLPTFRLKEGAPFRTVGGAVFGVEELHLVFER
ncbi:cytochrome P450 [Flavisphingomonas formosensis]|uniref:cytochrome P450 n=1 Tax=Flavisphingomonas formosensis TaxID=861534 RepID=UPI0012FA36D2|nr:cytochrome P450 [Sphingomonas formosensis]